MSQTEKELLREALLQLPAEVVARRCLWLRRRKRRSVELGNQLLTQRRQARSICDRLLALPPEGQAAKIRRSRGTYASLPLALELLRRSRQVLSEDPTEALRRTELAWDVAYSLARLPELCGGRRGLFDLNAQVIAALANTQRVACDWQGAEGAFSRAFRLLEEGTLDPLLEAKILSLYGSFLRDRRQLGAAVAVLERAAAICREFSASQLQARSLLKLATVLGESGRLDRACAANLRAWRMINEAEEPRLLISAWHNQVKLCVKAERYEEAALYLEEVPEVYERWHVLTDDLACLWVRGQIAWGLGQPHRAEEHLLKALQGFERLHDVYEAALVALDLATLYLQENRHAEVARVAETAYAGLRGQALGQKAKEAIGVLVESTRRQQVTLEIVRQTAAALHRHPVLKKGAPPLPASRALPEPSPRMAAQPIPLPAARETVRESELPIEQLDPWRFGRALRWLRFDRQMEFAEMVEKAGVTRGMLTSYETGAKRPSAATLEKIFEALGADGDDLREALLMVPGTDFLSDETLPVPKAQGGKGLDVRVLAAVLEEPELADAADAALRRVLREYRQRKWGYP